MGQAEVVHLFQQNHLSIESGLEQLSYRRREKASVINTCKHAEDIRNIYQTYTSRGCGYEIFFF